jgi:GT2 family glycosyltransferase
VRLGIIGCGYVTLDRHLPALRRVPEIEVVAVADAVPERAAEAARRTPRARAVGGFDPSFSTAEDRDFCSRWTAHGLRMSYEPRAVVEHAHDLTAASFARVHFDYGRGSFRHHRKQRRRGHPVAVEPSFYVTLTREARRAGVLAPLLLWHVAHTAGFAWEWARTQAAR